MYCVDEYWDTCSKTVVIALHPLGNDSNLFSFQLHRLIFDVSALTFRCKLCIPLGTTFELLTVFFSFPLAFTFTFFGGYHFYRMEIRKRKITCCGPIKNLSPALERKRVPPKRIEKKLHQTKHNIAEAHPHSMI
jgi:hypothetical protein